MNAMKITLALLLLFSLEAAFRQSKSSIHGVMFTAVSGDPVPGAVVRVLGSSQGTIANSDGCFEIERIGLRSITLQISALGFQKQTLTTLADNQEQLIIHLQEDSRELSEIVVSAESEATKISGLLLSLLWISRR